MIALRVGQRVRLTKMQRARLVVGDHVVFDFDKARGDTGVIEEIVRKRYTKVVVRLDPPNAGVMLLSPRNVNRVGASRRSAQRAAAVNRGDVKP